jgi:hypothetical protein
MKARFTKELRQSAARITQRLGGATGTGLA